MVLKGDNDGGLDGLGDRFSNVSNSGCGDVGGVWKSYIGVSVGDRWLKKFLMVETCICLYCHVWERMLE